METKFHHLSLAWDTSTVPASLVIKDTRPAPAPTAVIPMEPGAYLHIPSPHTGLLRTLTVVAQCALDANLDPVEFRAEAAWWLAPELQDQAYNHCKQCRAALDTLWPMGPGDLLAQLRAHP